MLTSSVPCVLVVDDEASVGRVLRALLRQEGIEARHVTSAQEALDVLKREPVDTVLTDLRMDGMSGMELLERVRARWSDVPVVVMTAHATIDVAVEAMKKGAVDFIIKPFDRKQIVEIVGRALTFAKARPEAPPPPEVLCDNGFVGASDVIRNVKNLLVRAGQGMATVLLHGESGTGKELAAKLIHNSSPRASGPFVTVNCGALNKELITAEFFGNERGAFTGAVARTPGRIELAQGGTLFLDEVAEIPLDTQALLLRVLQEREFERVRGTEKIKADVRFIAATHQSLPALVARKAFREDLFYRLNVLPVIMPPLRDHVEDIDSLALHFGALLSAANNRPPLQFDAEALAALKDHPWQGNVRELQNFIERLVMLSNTPRIGRREIEHEFARAPMLGGERASSALAPTSTAQPSQGAPEGNGKLLEGNGKLLEERRKSVEREALLEALEKTGNNRSQAARLLGISRRTLYNKIDGFKIG